MSVEPNRQGRRRERMWWNRWTRSEARRARRSREMAFGERQGSSARRVRPLVCHPTSTHCRHPGRCTMASVDARARHLAVGETPSVTVHAHRRPPVSAPPSTARPLSSLFQMYARNVLLRRMSRTSPAAARTAAIGRHLMSSSAGSSSKPRVEPPDEAPVLFESNGSVRTYVLNRPKKLNALNEPMLNILRPQIEVRLRLRPCCR